MFIHEQRQLETKRRAQPVPAARSQSCLQRGGLIACAHVPGSASTGARPDSRLGCSHPGGGHVCGKWVPRGLEGDYVGAGTGRWPATRGSSAGPWALLIVEGGRIKGCQSPQSPGTQLCGTQLCEPEEDKGGLRGSGGLAIKAKLPTAPHCCLLWGMGWQERNSVCIRDILGLHGVREVASSRHFQDFGHICVHLYMHLFLFVPWCVCVDPHLER